MPNKKNGGKEITRSETFLPQAETRKQQSWGSCRTSVTQQRIIWRGRSSHLKREKKVGVGGFLSSGETVVKIFSDGGLLVSRASKPKRNLGPAREKGK